MARINIEDSLYRDSRFFDLAQRLGGQELALGTLVIAWGLAQKWWTTVNDRLIPMIEWRRMKHADIILEVGLAREKDGKVYVCGSTEQFRWLEQRQNAGRKNIGKSRKRPLTTVDGSNPPSPSPSPSPSLPQSHSQSQKQETYSVGRSAENGASPLPQEIKSSIGFFIGRYVQAYQQRYGPSARPSLSGKVQGQIRRFTQETPLERACELIQTYLAMDDAWFITKAHDFGTFVENLTKIGLRLDTGQSSTAVEARNQEKIQAWQNQAKRIAEGKL